MGCCGTSSSKKSGKRAAYRQDEVSGGDSSNTSLYVYIAFMVVVAIVVALGSYVMIRKNQFDPDHKFIPIFIVFVLAFAGAMGWSIYYNVKKRADNVNWSSCGLYALYSFVIPLVVIAFFMFLLYLPLTRDASGELSKRVVKAAASAMADEPNAQATVYRQDSVADKVLRDIDLALRDY